MTEEEKKKVIKILRSLIISSPQKGKSIRELVRDYHENVGTVIPIFGNRNVEDFLRSTGEFIIENFRGELIIYERPNEESWHISKLVAEQQRTKKKPSSGRFRQPMRPPVRAPNFPSQQRTAYALRSPAKTLFPKKPVYQSPVNTPVHQRIQPTMEFTFDQYKDKSKDEKAAPNNRLTNDVPTRAADKIAPSEPQRLQNQPAKPLQSDDLRNRINQKREKPSPTTIDLTGDDSADSKDSCYPAHQINGSVLDKKPTPVSPKKIDSFSTNRQDPQQAPAKTPNVHPPLTKSNPFYFDVSKPPPATLRMQDRLNPQPPPNQNIGERRSVNDRLRLARDAMERFTPTVTVPVGRASVTPQQASVTPQQSPVTTPSSPLPQTAELILFDYCKDNRLSIPKFKIFKSDQRFHCHVTIDNTKYSSYPKDYDTEIEARTETAKHALDRLYSIRDMQRYEVCMDSEVDLAIKIYNCIKHFSNGVFSKRIPEEFLSAQKQLLPTDWMTTLAKHPEWFTIDECINDHIVYAVEAAVLERKMDKLELPWSDEYWSLIITCTVSTAEVWGRLVGEAYSNALDSLVTDIELELLKNKPKPDRFIVGKIYLTLMNECAYRVRVEKVDEIRKQCLCFGVDEGDQRWYPMDDLYVCKSKFLKLAPQAVRFALHGMEEFDENKFAKKHLEETLLSSTPLIGEIFTTHDQFIAQDESADLEPTIQIVLYDTSTSEDINLHRVIVDKICGDIPAPELIHQELTKVKVSHISDNGDIFIQPEQNGVHYVNKLIHKLTQSDPPQKTLSASNSANNTLFLVYDDDTRKWCRGKFINEVKDLKTNEMLFVDSGKTKSVPLAKIYRLESMSQALLTFPPQAIQVKLKGLTEVPRHLVPTLRGYFSGDTTAYVIKTNVTSSIPEVSLYYYRDSCMISVNENLETEVQRQLQESDTTSYSRQSSISSNSSRETKARDELSNLGNLSLSGRKLPKFVPPVVGDHFNVEVVMVSNPSNFKIRPLKHMQQWAQQMNALQDHCNKNRSELTFDTIREDEAYACLHIDGKWYRVIVERHLVSKLLVSYCDIGELDCIDDASKFKVLPDEYRHLPKMAMSARLYGIEPSNGLWANDDGIEFSQLVSGRRFQAIVGRIEDKKPDDNALLDVQLIDVSNESYDIVINDQLVESGRAIHARF